MVVVEYKVSLLDDFRIGDTIMITNRTGAGWKAMINNKFEIAFEAVNENSIPLLIDGYILVDVNDRWEKMWACCKENPFQVGLFKTEQDKFEKFKKNENLYMENLIHIDELEVVQATNPHNPPIRFSFRTQSRTYNLIIPTKDGMANNARLIMKALRNKEKSLSKPAATPAVPISKPIQITQQQSGAQALSRSAPLATSPLQNPNFREQVNQANHHNYNANNLHPVPNLSTRESPREQHQNHHTPPPPTHQQYQQQQHQHQHQHQQQSSHQPHQTPPPPQFNSLPQRKSPSPPPSQHHNNQSGSSQPHHPPQIQNQLATQLMQEKKVQIQAPPPSANNSNGAGRSSPGPGQSQIGGSKWLSNIKSIVNPKAASSLNVTQKEKQEKKASVNMTKSQSLPDMPTTNTRNTQNVALAIRGNVTAQKPGMDSPKGGGGGAERKILTRVYWRDGTYHTVEVYPGITAKEICEFCTKKTKVAIFENLFCLYECLSDGTERILDPKSNISELLLTWGEESENHLVCDLNLGTKNTVKTQLRKTLAVSQRDDDTDDSSSDLDTNDFGQLDDLESEPSGEDESIAMMIQEMIKLKHQLQEEDEMIERLNVEEQEVDMLISRLANL